MKVIDIMQKVANREISKFKIDDVNYYVDKSNYICEEDGTKVEWCIDDEWLNMNAEVIEEDKKIEHLDIYNCFKVMGIDKTGRLDENFTDISNKINEIIDRINNAN